jgi:hypothetical protein
VIAKQDTHYTTKVEERKPHNHQRKIAQNSEWPIDMGLLLVGLDLLLLTATLITQYSLIMALLEVSFWRGCSASRARKITALSL